ncbi:MAG: hypothetical protein ACJART_000231 [Maribacter sp.]|jgi:hypothetical protein
MRKLGLYLAFITSVGLLNAQEQHNPITIGDVLVLSQPSGSSYQHIDFPRPNIIIKRGAIANFNNLVGQKLIVKNIIIDDDGGKKAILARKDGRNFFRFFPRVTSDLDKALAKGELKILITENVIAQH